MQGITGFLQAPTLARLPPGVIFSDDGTLSGIVRFDPYREMNYDVTKEVLDVKAEPISIKKLVNLIKRKKPFEKKKKEKKRR